MEGPTHTELNLIGESNPEPVEAPLRRSNRVQYQSDRYYDFLVQDGDPMKLDKNDEDPITYMEAMQRFNFQKWLEAMKSEIESVEINSVWTLADPSEGIKSIGHKWIFKRQRGADKKVETYKARLVAKSYHQHYSIDYDETFPPVAMLKSIQIMLTIATYLDYEI